MNDDFVEELEALSKLDPHAASLAEMASLAVEIEPALLRRLRRRLLPGASPLAETLVWSSALVSARTPSSLVFHPDACAALRARLRRRQKVLDAARAIIDEAHRGVAEVLRCEEELVYLGLVDLDEQPRQGWTRALVEERIRRRVDEVLAALAQQPDRRTSLLAWTSRALPSLPAAVQDHEATRALMTVTYLAEPTQETAIVQVRWQKPGLVLRWGDGPAEGAASLRVPASAQVLLAVEAGRTSERLVLSPGDEVRVPVSPDEDVVRVRSLLGGALTLHRQGREPRSAGTAPDSVPVRVLVAGPAEYVLPRAQERAAEALGAALALAGCRLVTGGYAGVDHIAGRAFAERLAAGAGEGHERIEKERLLQIVRRDRPADLPRGTVLVVESPEDEYWEPVARAEAVVVIGGTAGVREVVRTARLAGRPVLAYPGTGTEGIAGTLHPGEGGADGSAAARIVETAVRVARTPSAVASWLGPDLLALATDYLRPQPFEASESTASRLRDEIAANPDSWHGLHSAVPTLVLGSDSPPVRVLGYLAVQVRPAENAESAHSFEAHPWTLLDRLNTALVRELDLALELHEIRPLWQGLLALKAVFERSDLSPGARDAAGRTARTILAALNRKRDVDRGGRCQQITKEIVKERAFPEERALATLERLADEYDALRRDSPAGSERTGKMNALVDRAQKEADRAGIERDAVERMFASGGDGARVVALACCMGRTSQAPLPIVAEAIHAPRTPFEQWTAIQAVRAVVLHETPSSAEPFAAALLAAYDDPKSLINDPSDRSRRTRAEQALQRFALNVGLGGQGLMEGVRLWISAREPTTSEPRPCAAVLGSSETAALADLGEALGERLAARGWRLAIGRGDHVGPAVVAGYRRRGGPALRIHTSSSPEPPDDPSIVPSSTPEQARRRMLGEADACVVLAGGSGTEAEVALAMEMGLPVLPAGFTGGTAHRVIELGRRTLAGLGLPESLLPLLDIAAPAAEAAERVVRLLDIVMARRPRKKAVE